jgi:polysaccharide export outer membrane protein
MGRTWRVRLPALWLAMVVCGATGCAGIEAHLPDGLDAPERAVELKGRYRREYVLGPLDAVEVIVRGDESASRTVEIRPDGGISLPYVGDVQAAGLTVQGLAAMLTERLRVRLVEPEVTVIATKVREPQVYVLGQVAKPGPVPLRMATTAVEAMANAGDMLRGAAAHYVALIRLGDDGVLRVRVIGSSGGGQPGPYIALGGTVLEPEDILFVPERSWSQASRLLDEFSKPFIAIAAAMQPYVNLKVIENIGD